MFDKWRTLTAAAFCAALVFGQAQSREFITLEIEWDNFVNYNGDVADYSKLQASANRVDVVTANLRNFIPQLGIADIVTVNGKPARGFWLSSGLRVALTPSPMPGQAIGDVVRAGVTDLHFEILQADGTPIGSIMTSGFSGGPAPPGVPPGFFRNPAVTGGTGAYLGATGFMVSPVGGVRAASMEEDPVNRRTHGGGRGRFIVYLIPFSRPEIRSTTSGPAVFHTDFSPVSSATPARAGETLILMATGLGPTRPGIAPGTPFPESPLQEVNSPVDVSVSGRSAEVVNKIGWPGTTDTYRVDIRVPDGMTSGMATVRLTAAFIPGREVSIPVR